MKCPDCGVKVEKVPLLPRKAPFSKRFEDAVGQACESAAARQVARRFGLSESTVRAIDLRYLERWTAKRCEPPLRQMGVDELYRGKNDKFLRNYFGVGPTVSLPVFSGGRIRSNVEIQNARLRETAAIYKSTILRAFEETENALVAYANEQDRRDRLEATVRSDETSFDLANVQYKAGLTDFLTVLDAQRQMYTNQDLLAQSQTSVTTT